MTLLATIFPPSETEIVVAADSGVLFMPVSPPSSSYVNAVTERWAKLHIVPNQPLMIGVVGQTLSSDFLEWIGGRLWTSWGHVEHDLRKQLDTFNGTLANPNVSFHTNLLAVGFVGQKRRALFLSAAQFRDEVAHGEQFFGYGSGTARACAQVLRKLSPETSLADPEVLRRFMTGLTESVPELRAPVDVWRITPSGCELLPDVSVTAAPSSWGLKGRFG